MYFVPTVATYEELNVQCTDDGIEILMADNHAN